MFPLTLFVAVVLLGSNHNAQQPQPPAPDFAADLRGRHPEIDVRPDYRGWFEGVRVGPWYETRMDADRRRTVVVQSEAGHKVFAAQVVMTATPTVQRTALVDLTALRQTRSEAIQMTAGRWATPRLRAARPVVEFRPDGTWTFSWEFEVNTGARIETYRLQDKVLQLKSVRDPELRRMNPPAPRTAARTMTSAAATAADPIAPDDLADNELHTLSLLAAEANGWTQGAATAQDKAFRIFRMVDDTYSYDATIAEIRNLTWADELTRDRNGRAGICDELAVVAVTYLRAIGIPARLKLMRWIDATGNGDSHEALEYYEDTAWRHMDIAFHTFNDPGIYRQNGLKQVMVMDVMQPLDSRWTGDAYGAPDVAGDRRLHSYYDFVVVPADYLGVRVPRYSF
jgi:transglutaminase-like putative cysteine protease